MPRGPRIDWLGACQHVMVRGVNRTAIFADDDDREDLFRRLEQILVECEIRCFAWVFMLNHVHLVLQTHRIPLELAMRRVLTGYALCFNRRHGRVGHLFQDRFKSRLVVDDPDLMGLVRYVHLNPIEAGLVPSVDALRRHRWCGHGALVGARRPPRFQNPWDTLSLFGHDRDRSIESLEGWMRSRREARGDASSASPANGRSPEVEELRRLRRQVCAALDVDPADVLRGGKSGGASRARGLLARAALNDLGLSCRAAAPELGATPSAIARAARRE